MNKPLALPTEIWSCIIAYIYLPDLVDLSRTCTRLHETCTERIAQQVQIRNSYRRFNEREARNSQPFAWHALLLSILRQDVPAAYIEEVNGDKIRTDEDEPYDVVLDPSYRAKAGITVADEELIRQAVMLSPWILESRKDEYADQILLGDEDAALCLLIPLLRNLRWLGAPNYTTRLQEIISRIATAYTAEAEAIAQNKNIELPLRKLILVTSDVFGERGMELEHMAPYAALPSVKRIVMCGTRSDTFPGWPTATPPSRVREVFFQVDTIQAAAIRGFAQGFRGPCTFRQDFSPWVAGGFMWQDEPLEWDHLEISGEVDDHGFIREGTRREVLTTRYSLTEHGLRPSHVRRRGSNYSDGMNLMFNWRDLVDWRSLEKMS